MKPAVRFPAFDFTIVHPARKGRSQVSHTIRQGVSGPDLGWESALQAAVRQSYREIGALQPFTVNVLGCTPMDDAPFTYMVRTSRNDVLVVTVLRAAPSED